MNRAKIAWITGWVLTVLVAVLLIGPSAGGKFIEWEGKAEAMEKLGYSIDLIKKIGVVEIAVALLLLVPRTSFLGAILVTGYLGGATATHVRVGDPFVMPIVVGVVVWIALGLRKPEVFRLAFGIEPAPSEAPQPAVKSA